MFLKNVLWLALMVLKMSVEKSIRYQGVGLTKRDFNREWCTGVELTESWR